jgi:hypothetical protein
MIVTYEYNKFSNLNNFSFVFKKKTYSIKGKKCVCVYKDEMRYEISHNFC